MADDLDAVKTEIAELRKLLQASPAAKGGKDIWEKISTLSTLFSTVILGAVGLFATQVYNQHQLEQQRQDALEKARIERAQVLDKFMHYVASAEPREREFGYAMFAYFDQADLALKLIALNKDKAGTAVLETLKQSSDPGIRSAALAALLTLQQEETVRRLLTGREGTDYGLIQDCPGASPNECGYGIGYWTIGNGGLFKLLYAYTQRPNAQYAPQVKSLIATGTVVKTPELNSTLNMASADPVMRQTQDDMFRSDVIEPALSVVQALGLRLPLSIAIVCDTSLNNGLDRAKKLADQATSKTGNSPKDGGDEKQWTMNFLDARSGYLKSLAIYARLGKGLESRVEFFRQLARSDDWMLATPEAEAAVPHKPN
jgi:predicted negative regulator of RcsB-dependent stress response